MAKINTVTDLTIDDDVAVLTLNSPPVNALSRPMVEGIIEGIRAASASSAKIIILMCGGRTFIAGGDINSFGKGNSGPTPREAMEAIEASAKLVVAAIHGTALGGGLEAALAASYRVAVPSAKIGLPEVKLGLLPGAGGTQRLTRLVGVEAALEIMTSGRLVEAAQALELGILDALVEGELRDGAIAFARALLADGKPARRVRDLNNKVAAVRDRPEIFADFRKSMARRSRGFKAPELIVQAVEAAVHLTFNEGYERELALFNELLASPESAAQRYSFFIERTAQKIPDIEPSVQTLPIAKVGVIGAGTMGGGIAMNFANAGLPVTIVETTEAGLIRGLGIIRKNYESTVARGGITAVQAEERLNKLTGTLRLEDLADCDLVIEAAFEDMEVKKAIFAKLDAVCGKDTILATNTSFLNIDEIATAVRRPEDVLGLHFFSPANVMKLLEIVRPAKARKEIVATTVQLAKKIGKSPIVVGVCHGFLANRTLDARQLQATALVMDGAAPADVDRVMYEFGFPMGPFAMWDLVGLDVIKDRPGERSLCGALAEKGRLGQKGAGGFYDYDEQRRPTPSPVAQDVIDEFRRAAGKVPRAISDREILERLIFTVANEGAKVLEEKIAIRSSDIDLAWQHGYGWPPYKGGPMYHVDEVVGLPVILEKLRAYQAQHGEAFQPARLLVRLAAEGRKFSDLPPNG
ncbi:MAG: 3-hydroxybutyryl-CoA epimerase [Bradyrhizobium sp.]|nr:3-hydroxybutyryl-CoA epimerase [Bradyrhizobium sp.]